MDSIALEIKELGRTMKKILICCLFIFGLTSIAFSQGVDPGIKKKIVAKSKKKVNPIIAEAEKAWIPFWANLREIIKNRNSKGLFELMAEDYNSQYNSTNRNTEIGKYDKSNPDNKYSWDKLENESKGRAKLLKKGISVNCYGNTKTISKLLPGNWNNITHLQSLDRDFLLFEFRINRWFFVAYAYCENG